MQSFIVLASLVSELAGGQNDPPLRLNVPENILVLLVNPILSRAFLAFYDWGGGWNPPPPENNVTVELGQ